MKTARSHHSRPLTENPTVARENRLGVRGWQALGLAFGLTLSVSCHADGAAIATTGAGAAPACQTCHGPAGEGIAQAGFPRLAGLGAAYMQRQLDAFADGTRVNAVMMPIAQALSDTDRAAVSAYYAALPEPPGPTTPKTASTSGPEAAAVGATLATRGRWADTLPACENCHGPGGRGVGPDFPLLAGQSAAYLAGQLTAWKAGTRPPGPMGLMTVVARKLSDDEVRAIADYYAELPARGSR
ncbi:c-type cytochrome [Methyloversatilis sp.]|uniref:c-type cytochrome n=1 Tax=Methyloversatilis sp. TaxID=2569862 RepID=UPI002734F495|nr:c-type cytochrome [Methyloversatilis sp.]MDP2867566.1 c-type cytochrome [Methyloversatilis sp.]MDP3456013.1 c-type cytochrome [Methyloversatilis sp.]MDP3579773.1 c-type cytochrome [Methyloversatilis sp.]